MKKRDEITALEAGHGVLASSADDEPLFILCGRDPQAPSRVRDWADEVELAIRRGEIECTTHLRIKIDNARRSALDMETFQAAGNRKQPD